MKVLVQLCMLAAFVAVVSARQCLISQHCGDPVGREVCVGGSCRKNIPCNKDNDCFFWGGADVAHNYPHPRCYKYPNFRSEPGYGICMLVEKADHKYSRIPGPDVQKLGKLDTFQ